MHGGWVYILSSNSGTLYIGVTSDLFHRILEHRAGVRSGFASKYHCERLVYRERFEAIIAAIAREKELKGWSRAKKIALIEGQNPEWRDLAQWWGRHMLHGPEKIADQEELEKRRIKLTRPR